MAGYGGLKMNVELNLRVTVFDAALLAATAERLAGLSGMTPAEWSAMRDDHPAGLTPVQADLVECLIGSGEQTPIPVEAGYEL